MALRLITAYRGRDCEIYLWGKDEEGRKLSFIIEDFRPFFYIEADQELISEAVTGSEWGYNSVFGEPLRKVFVVNPSAIMHLTTLGFHVIMAP